MKNPFSIISAILLLLSVAGCAPSRHAIHVEMRHPSKSGLELGGKIVSVVYSSSADAAADAYNENMAASFAEALEKDYGTGKGSVGLYCADSRQGDYSKRDSLVSILMSTGADMVFFFAPMHFKSDIKASVPVKVDLYCYDGMNKEDKVFAFTGNTVVSSYDKDTIADEATDAGKVLAESFSSQWKHEQYSIAYYDSQKWYDALLKAEQYDWKGAMDVWFTLLDTNNLIKRASAEYNIAVACYMLGDYALAEEWLNKSVTDNEMPTLTDAMRKRINRYLTK